MFKKISLSSFVMGALCGFLLFTILVGGFTLLYFSRGITLTLGVADVSSLIQKEVSEIIEIQLPHYVDGMKKEIPYIVDREMTGQIKNASIKIGDMEYPLPPDSVKGIEDNFKTQVQFAMIQLLDGLDEKVLAESISADVVLKIDGYIEENLDNQVFNVSPLGRISIPVTINVDYDDGLPVTSFNLTQRQK